MARPWLEKFKMKHKIRCLDMKGEKLSADSDAADALRMGFNQFLTEENYDWDNTYSAGEFSMF